MPRENRGPGNAYQEQTSRENLAVRKQAQVAMREVQTLHADKATLQTRMDRAMLDSNALEVQLKTLKNLLDERGVQRGRRAAQSHHGEPRGREPVRHAGPEPPPRAGAAAGRERQGARRAAQRVARRARQETAREWEEKLQLLTNDHHESIKYVRALEKYLTKMKAEVQKSKSAAAELETQLATRGAEGGADPGRRGRGAAGRGAGGSGRACRVGGRA